MANRTVRLEIRLTSDERARLERIAEVNQTTMTKFLTEAIKNYKLPRQQKSAVPTYQAKHSAFA